MNGFRASVSNQAGFQFEQIMSRISQRHPQKKTTAFCFGPVLADKRNNLHGFVQFTLDTIGLRFGMQTFFLVIWYAGMPTP